MELPFAGLQRGFGALALGDLFCSNVDSDNFAGRAAERMPISDPESLIGLIGALTGEFDAGDRFPGFHDRADDAFNGVSQRRHAIPDRPSQMILHGYAADLREALVD